MAQIITQLQGISYSNTPVAHPRTTRTTHYAKFKLCLPIGYKTLGAYSFTQKGTACKIPRSVIKSEKQTLVGPGSPVPHETEGIISESLKSLTMQMHNCLLLIE